MAPPNSTWRDILTQAQRSPDILRQTEVIRNVQNILATNVAVCTSLGQPFLSQIMHIYPNMLHVYR